MFVIVSACSFVVSEGLFVLCQHPNPHPADTESSAGHISDLCDLTDRPRRSSRARNLQKKSFRTTHLQVIQETNQIRHIERGTWNLGCFFVNNRTPSPRWDECSCSGKTHTSGKKKLLMPDSDYSCCVIGVTLQDHKDSEYLCCYWSVTDGLLFSVANPAVTEV